MVENTDCKSNQEKTATFWQSISKRPLYLNLFKRVGLLVV